MNMPSDEPNAQEYLAEYRELIRTDKRKLLRVYHLAEKLMDDNLNAGEWWKILSNLRVAVESVKE